MEQGEINKEKVLAYKNFNISKKKKASDQESSASNTVAGEDWINEVNSLVVRKIKVSCADDTLILAIEFMRSEDYEKEFALKRKEKIPTCEARCSVIV